MAQFNFNLKDPKSDKATPVNLIVRYSYKRVKFYTREAIHPDFWNNETQRAKQSRLFPEYPEFNSRLNYIETTAKDIFRRYQNDNNHNEPSPGEYKKLLENEIKGNKVNIPNNLIEFAEYFIEQLKQKLIIQKRDTKSIIAGSYSQTLSCIKEFAKDKNRSIDFDTMDNDFYNEFINYLETTKTITKEDGKVVRKYGFTANTIGKHIKNLKRILNEASRPEIGVNKFVFYKRFKVLEEEVDSIYLDENELQALYDLDLASNKKLEHVRDLFLIGCWTGLRFSDFTNIKSKDIHNDFIHIKTQKTGEKVVIPIHWTIKAVMNKYRDYPNTLPPNISNVNMNVYLKELGKLLEILHQETEISKTRAGRRVISKKPKYKLLTTHCARRSFATNMFKAGVPTISIMKVTGHRTEKAFLRYIKITPDEHAKILMKYFQKHKLRIA